MNCSIKLLHSILCLFIICSAHNTTNNIIKYDFLRHTIKDIPLIYKKFYHTNDIYKFIDNLHIQNTNFVKVSTIGFTVQGTPLKIIEIKPDNNFNNYDIIWIDGGTHAREWITISSVIYIANELIYNRHNLPLYMRNKHYVLMPIVNPDGYTYAYEKERLWRKNRFKTHNENCIGIDLNRNWNYNWNNTNSCKNACSESYRGPAPNSELEIKSIIQFIMNNLTKLKGFITFHSYGQVIMYPWAYTKVHINDYKEHHYIAISMALKIYKKTSKTYTVGSASTMMYKVSGTSIDWMKGIANIKYVFAIELRDEGVNGFNLSENEIIPTGQEAFCAVSILADNIASNYESNIHFVKLHKLCFILCINLSIYNVIFNDKNNLTM